MKNALKKVIVYILQIQAKQVLKKYNPKIIAVTGSVGKTSTKDAIFAVLSPTRYIRKSEKSFNSEIGVPLTILGCNNAWSNPFAWLGVFAQGLNLMFTKNSYPDWLVLEVGADRPGDIKSLTSWLKPDVSVVTRFGKMPVHVEFFKTREDLVREKSYLVESLKRGGVAVLNYDDQDVREFGKYTESDKLFFGFEDCTVKASHYHVVQEDTGKGKMPVGISFEVEVAGVSTKFQLFGSIGKHHVYPALAAIAVGHTQGLAAADMAQALKSHIPPRARMRLIDGIKGSLIIDDTYNSSPVAAMEALNTLASLKDNKRKIAILGDMMELGLLSSDAHKEIGELAATACDMLVTVGVRSRKIAEAALDANMSEKNVYQFDDAVEAGAFIQNMIEEGDVILVKGSQSMRMERTVKDIMAMPENAADLLVRQEEEWLSR